MRRLLFTQHPDLATLGIESHDAGWDNAMFRLGADLAVRLPRRASAVPLLEHEQRWLPSLAARLPLPVPAPVRMGEPGEGYPWRWSVVPWIGGQTADVAPPAGGEARTLAHFLAHLHVPAPHDAPVSRVRGVPLAQRAEAIEQRLRGLESSTSFVTARIWDVWKQALAAAPATRATWIHGDLHPRNVLVQEGALTGIVDWGDMSAGDAATDLAAIWMLFASPSARAEAMAAYPAGNQALWARARGWALGIGSALLETGLRDHPRHARIGALTLERVAEGG